MRSAGNFHPEWGYLAPAPSFMRTARIVLVATAIGATAGAAVMISLVQHPEIDAANTPIAAHALVTSVPVVAEAPVAAEPVAEPAVTQTLPPMKPSVAATASPAVPQMQAATPAAKNAVSTSKPSTISPPQSQAPGNVATLAGPPAPASAPAERAGCDPTRQWPRRKRPRNKLKNTGLQVTTRLIGRSRLGRNGSRDRSIRSSAFSARVTARAIRFRLRSFSSPLMNAPCCYASLMPLTRRAALHAKSEASERC